MYTAYFPEAPITRPDSLTGAGSALVGKLAIGNTPGQFTPYAPVQAVYSGGGMAFSRPPHKIQAAASDCPPSLHHQAT